MEDFKTWISSLGIVSFLAGIIIAIFKWNGNKLVDRIEKLELQREKISEKIQGHTYQISNLEADSAFTHKQLEQYNNGISRLTETINILNANVSESHKESKEVMERSNELIKESSEINRQLLGYLKGKG